MALEFLDESDIKGSKVKKSGLEHKIELVNKSDVGKDPRILEKEKKSGLEFLAKEKVFVCERTRAGMTNNCPLCKELSRDRFDRCSNKYGGP